jgi:hypothetical protein
MATRFVVAPQPQAMAIDAEEVEEEVVKPMPSFDVVWAQYTTLAQRLREAATLPAYSRWSGASGTVIMKNVFTEPRFYSKVGDFLYIWLHMATKSMCEAVIEGMGGVWDRSNRHGNWETAIEEAVVAWNSPQPYHPAAIPFINHSLNHLFKGEGKWHDKFTHQDNTHIERRVGSGVVMARHKKDPQRLPDSFYDTSAL